MGKDQPMSPILYFGADAGVHKPEFRNPAFRVFELQGDTLNFDIRLNNDGAEIDGVTINLYVLHYSHMKRHLDSSRMIPKEIDAHAVRAMSGQPLRTWRDHFVPECKKPAWHSDTILHRLPTGTIGYLLVATVGIQCIAKRSEPVRPSENPQIALWTSEKLESRC